MKNVFIASVFVFSLCATLACESETNEPKASVASAKDENAKNDKGIISKASWGKHKLKLEFLQTTLLKTPCDKKRALEYAEKLIQVQEYEMTVEHTDKHLKECGDWYRILWPKMAALRYLKRYKEGAEVGSLLIKHKASDSDYWWWRGRQNAKAGFANRAEADFRQSNANKPSGYGSGKMSLFLGDERPCETAFMISRYIEQSPRKVQDWAQPALTKRWAAGGCDALAGKGSTTIRFKKNAPLRKSVATIGNQIVKSIVDDKAGYTVISKTLAETLKLEVQDDQVQTLALGQVVSGQVALVNVGVKKARAAKVKVLVVESVPGNVDAVLGQSFFARFKNTLSESSLRLTKR